jgi:hypothetical protein
MPSGGKQKDLNVLRKIIEADGYKVVPSGSGHWRILNAKGAVVVDDNGPVIMSGTTSEIRGRDMAVHRLMKAGILKRDPWAPTPKREGERDTEEMNDAERAAHEREMEERRTTDHLRAQRTLRIRERLEPVVARLGGWEKRGMVAEVGLVAHYFADRKELPERWTSPSGAAENAEALRKGATLSDNIANLWEHLLSELESWPDTQLRWMQLLREAKGVDEPTIGEAVTPLTRSSPQLQVVTGKPLPQLDELPTLALRAMFEMGVGRPAHDPDRAHVLRIGEEIMRLEIQARRSDRPADVQDEEGNDDDGDS